VCVCVCARACLSIDRSVCVPSHAPSEVGVLVLINKRKEKRGVLGDEIRYYAAQEIADRWCVFPWDAQDIEAHERLAVKRAGK
jgi:hypoxanthine phosphoribosyltransferase